MEHLSIEDYKLFGGSQTDFPNLLIDAECYLEKVTFNRINKVELDDKIKRCIVLLIDEIVKAKSRNGIISYSNGFESWSYSNEESKRMYDICKTYLDPRLLFRGVGC